MAQVISCPSCARRLLFAVEAEQANVQCPACGHAFRAEREEAHAPLDIPRVLPLQAIPLDDPPPIAQPEPLDVLPLPPPEYAGPVIERRPLPRAPGLWKGTVGTAAVGCAFFLTCAGILGTMGSLLWVRAPGDVDFGNGERRATFRRAALAGKGDGEQIQAMLDEVGAAINNGDMSPVVEECVAERLASEIKLHEGGLLHTSDRSQARRLVGRVLRDALGVGWTRTEIRSTRWLPDGDREIVTRHTQADGTSQKFRWWVSAKDGEWRFYDFEDLTTGMRYSISLESDSRQRERPFDGQPSITLALSQAFAALQRGDVQAAADCLDRLKRAELPKPLEGIRQLVLARLALERGQFVDAMECVGKARELRSDMPILDLVEGSILNRQGKWQDAHKHLTTYCELLGDDDEVCAELGLSLRGLSRFDEAAFQYRKALDCNARNGEAFLGLLYSLAPQDRRDDVPGRFARLGNLKAHFLAYAPAMKENHNGWALEEMAVIVRRTHPDLAAVHYYLALAKAWDGKTEEAIARFRDALAKEGEGDQRRIYTATFLEAMGSSGQALEAYAVAPDAREGFRILAAQALLTNRDLLLDLVPAHKRRHADDRWLPFYEGEAYAWQEDFARANEAFRAGLSRPPEGSLDAFRASRVLARFHVNRALSAYEEIGPPRETFLQLASLLLTARQDDVLEQLLEAHGRAEPKSADVARFTWRLKIKQGEGARAAALFKTAIAKTDPDSDERRELVNEFLFDMVAARRSVVAYQAAPDTIAAFAILAEELLDEDRPKELEGLIDSHRNRHPDDPHLAVVAGSRLQKDKKWKEAARVFADAWDKTHEDKRGSLRWRYVYALYQAGETMRAYRDVGPAEDTFLQLANLLSNDRRGADLETLIEAHRLHAWDTAQLAFLKARAQVFLGKYDEACASLKTACDRQPDEAARRWPVTQWMQDMVAAGKWREAYRGAPDRTAAFAALGGKLLLDQRLDDLEALLGEHEKQADNDPLLLYYSGACSLARGRLAEADERLSTALERAPANQVWMIRRSLVQARIRSGQIARTLKQFADDKHAFTTLAYACVDEKNAGQLAALVAARRETRPNDCDLPAWELETCWLTKDYAGALRLLNEHRVGLLGRPSHRWKRDEYLVRCLVRLRRPKEALREATALTKSGAGDSLLLVLAHAANGDVAATLDAMRHTEGQFFSERCYLDEDLGPLLRGKAFQPFRDRYPEPKK